MPSGISTAATERASVSIRSKNPPPISAAAGISRPSPADRVIAIRMLERFGIAHLAGRPYTNISGGERQLTLLARALAHECDVAAG